MTSFVIRTVAACAALILSTGMATAADPKKALSADRAVVDAIVAATFKNAPAEWQARIVQDEAQKLCSQYPGGLPDDLYQKVLKAEQATIVYPADGKVLGDWKNGQKLAQRGTGGQFSDNAETPKGGNCYACHQLSPKELSYGTLGPSLTGYGKAKGFAADEAKAAYAKIYNAQSAVPCSNMPRFGHSKFLNEQELKDLTAYLFDPESPVNK
jgi:sulfur-oxidizing protein SoxX